MTHNGDLDSQVNLNKGNKSAFIVAICLNVAFVIAEIILGLINQSMALLTDAGHNASDVATLVLSLLAFLMAKKKINFKIHVWL